MDFPPSLPQNAIKVARCGPDHARRTSYLAAINGSVFMPTANILVRSKCKGCSGNQIIEEALFRYGIFELNVAPLRTITG